MISVARTELFKQLKTFKALVIVAIFIIVSYSASNFFKSNESLLGFKNNTAFYSSIRLLVILFGYIFVSTISYNCINNEIELKTIRLVINKISRTEFIIGKLLGISAFWFLCLTVSFSVVSAIAGTFSLSIYLLIIVAMFYFICLVIFLSTIVEKQSVSNFLGIIVGLLMPTLGLWSTLSNSNIIFRVIRYIFPYYYMLKEGPYLLIPAIIGVLFILMSLKVFIGKDL
ncbi:ABC transporter permease [Ruminiclostridium josui]|uniref:ABC transporter permease n=1 Tax=Ruminiclostridium josui TaxID=1499 RepID=UPI00046507FA|nr:ABC transporter permease [Ruminiclostridium josui]